MRDDWKREAEQGKIRHAKDHPDYQYPDSYKSPLEITSSMTAQREALGLHLYPTTINPNSMPTTLQKDVTITSISARTTMLPSDLRGL